jgi:hypothetical protein
MREGGQKKEVKKVNMVEELYIRLNIEYEYRVFKLTLCKITIKGK